MKCAMHLVICLLLFGTASIATADGTKQRVLLGS